VDLEFDEHSPSWHQELNRQELGQRTGRKTSDSPGRVHLEHPQNLVMLPTSKDFSFSFQNTPPTTRDPTRE
jgi:hypothetical protein